MNRKLTKKELKYPSAIQEEIQRKEIRLLGEKDQAEKKQIRAAYIKKAKTKAVKLLKEKAELMAERGEI